MNLFHVFLMTSAFFCSLVAGFLLAFTIVVMPGIKTLGNREFIKTFQVIDNVIQNRQPIFIILWLGSVAALGITVILGFQELEKYNSIIILSSFIIFLAGVHVPTIIINVPLNNKLQLINTDTEDEAACQAVRNNFEARWNRWNRIRTVSSSVASILLIILLLNV
ncbi:DUF1772 domain-containing protein [Melioribacter sp. Ez-97]|uniref:anthrone oxygenase family protein n=1 Tax=Melioribacter sp. Ez-97 TaxID=3423434 RepID=UPI003ED846AF